MSPKPLDIARIRAALAKLDALAETNPEAFAGRGTEEWIAVLERSDRIPLALTLTPSQADALDLMCEVAGFATREEAAQACLDAGIMLATLGDRDA